VAGHDEVRALESTTPRHETAKDGRRRGEGGIRDHVERATREAEISDVGSHDGDRVCGEAAPEHRGTFVVQLERDDSGTHVNERGGQRSGAGAQVQHEVATDNMRLLDEATRPLSRELVPPPAHLAVRGHGRSP
jgi:hypothetical protein